MVCTDGKPKTSETHFRTIFKLKPEGLANLPDLSDLRVGEIFSVRLNYQLYHMYVTRHGKEHGNSFIDFEVFPKDVEKLHGAASRQKKDKGSSRLLEMFVVGTKKTIRIAADNDHDLNTELRERFSGVKKNIIQILGKHWKQAGHEERQSKVDKLSKSPILANQIKAGRWIGDLINWVSNNSNNKLYKPSSKDMMPPMESKSLKEVAAIVEEKFKKKGIHCRIKKDNPFESERNLTKMSGVADSDFAFEKETSFAIISTTELKLHGRLLFSEVDGGMTFGREPKKITTQFTFLVTDATFYGDGDGVVTIRSADNILFQDFDPESDQENDDMKKEENEADQHSDPEDDDKALDGWDDQLVNDEDSESEEASEYDEPLYETSGDEESDYDEEADGEESDDSDDESDEDKSGCWMKSEKKKNRTLKSDVRDIVKNDYLGRFLSVNKPGDDDTSELSSKIQKAMEDVPEGSIFQDTVSVPMTKTQLAQVQRAIERQNGNACLTYLCEMETAQISDPNLLPPVLANLAELQMNQTDEKFADMKDVSFFYTMNQLARTAMVLGIRDIAGLKKDSLFEKICQRLREMKSSEKGLPIGKMPEAVSTESKENPLNWENAGRQVEEAVKGLGQELLLLYETRNKLKAAAGDLNMEGRRSIQELKSVDDELAILYSKIITIYPKYVAVQTREGWNNYINPPADDASHALIASKLAGAKSKELAGAKFKVKAAASAVGMNKDKKAGGKRKREQETEKTAKAAASKDDKA